MKHSLLLLISLYAGLSVAQVTDRPHRAPQSPYSEVIPFKIPALLNTTDKPALGISAPFTGISNGELLVAGGCNFPDKPAAEGGRKRYYKEIYAYNLTEPSRWRKVGDLPCPLAYGASVTTPKGIVWIAGNNDKGSSRQVLLINWDANGQRPTITELPALPVPADNLAATYADGTLYATGGNKPSGFSNALFSLQLIPSPQHEWVRLPDFPGPIRVQPILTAQQSAEGMRLYLAGGFQPATASEEAIVCTDILSYHPPTRLWRKEGFLPLQTDGSPYTATGGCAVSLGDSSILLIGGVNHNRFRDALNRPLHIKRATDSGNIPLRDSLQQEARNYLLHSVGWYKFNTSLLRYNTFSKTWEHLGDSDKAARAGAGIAITGDTLILINGEQKPGIRTPEVNAFRLTPPVP